ncbi:MAG: glycogen debranching enzyme N-terminal domain-containing protein [Thermaerobacter sp.]|nr:glycogen debranching enzyme N-terminal domain-containing protein [Thermaerobacter sp.]
MAPSRHRDLSLGGPDRIALPSALDKEWLLTNGRGGYAMGTMARISTRRYHGFLIAALKPPAMRRVIVGPVALELVVDGHHFPLWQAEWASGSLSPEPRAIRMFSLVDGQPQFVWSVGAWQLRETLAMVRGHNGVLARYDWQGPASGAELHVIPLLSGRDHHGIGYYPPQAVSASSNLLAVRWPYGEWVLTLTGSQFVSGPEIYRGMAYRQETARGLSDVEDWWVPGRFIRPLPAGAGSCWFSVSAADDVRLLEDPADWWDWEQTRRKTLIGRSQAVPSALALAADNFVVDGPSGSATIVAGYPWFSEWGRDSLIAAPGLSQALAEPELLYRVITYWNDARQQGLVPNRVTDDTAEVDLNSVDASLWWGVIAGQLAIKEASPDLGRYVIEGLDRTVEAFLRGTSAIGIDPRDGLVWAGSPGLALTWMDARYDGVVVTPRDGKPIEIQALWYNVLRLRDALAANMRLPRRYERAARQVRRSVTLQYPMPGLGLADAIRPDGSQDQSVRPNQLYAAGLPFSVVGPVLRRSILTMVGRQLYTPLGLRTLSPDHPGFRARYGRTVGERDTAYHQGMAWPYLLGIYGDALHATAPESWVSERPRIAQAMGAHMAEAGVGSISEIVEPWDGRPDGCPFQAWSVAEVVRILSPLWEKRAPVPS